MSGGQLISLMKYFEGMSQRPYWDIRQYSIGYGSRYRPGIHPNPMSEPYALQLLHDLIANEYRPAAKAAVEARGISWNSLAPHQQDAIVSFAYNLGSDDIGTASWPQHYKNGNLSAAKLSWVRHNKGDGSPMEGLVKRRFAEWQLFTTGTWSQNPPGWRAFWNAGAWNQTW